MARNEKKQKIEEARRPGEDGIILGVTFHLDREHTFDRVCVCFVC